MLSYRSFSIPNINVQQLLIGFLIGLFIILFILITLKKTSDPEQVKKIVEKKVKRKDLIGQIKDVIDEIEITISKLLADVEILEIFNRQNVSTAFQHTKTLKQLSEEMAIFENKELENEINEYVKDAYFLFNEIEEFEDQIYKKEMDYHRLRLIARKEYNKVTLTVTDEKLKKEFKDDVRQKLGEFKEKLDDSLSNRDEKRKRLKDELKKTRDSGQKLDEKLDKYKIEEIDKKRFYLRHLTRV